MVKRRWVSIAYVFLLIWIFGAPAAAAGLPAGAAKGAAPSLPVSPKVLTMAGQKVTLSGFYYGGSVPMIIDDITRTDYNMMLPGGCYVPLVGARPEGLKSGDRITATGVLERPAPGSPFTKSGALLRLASPGEIKVLSSIEKPGGMKKPFKPEILRRIERYGPGAVTPGKNRAVLIAGGGSPADNHIRYWNDLLTMYNILLGRGFGAADIHVYYWDGAPPGDTEGKLDGTMPVNGAATRGNISKCFRSIGAVSGNNDLIFIMANNHGGGFLAERSGPYEPGLHGGRITDTGEPGDAISEAAYNLDLNGDGDKLDTVRADESIILHSGRYYDDDFVQDLAAIQNYRVMIIHLEQCFSGGFIDDLRAPGRIVYSAAAETRLSRSHRFSTTMPVTVPVYNEFFYWFAAALLGETLDGDYALDRNGAPWTPNADADGSGKVSVLEAYMFARRLHQGDGIPWYGDDGLPGYIKQNYDTRNWPQGKIGWLGSRTFF